MKNKILILGILGIVLLLLLLFLFLPKYGSERPLSNATTSTTTTTTLDFFQKCPDLSRAKNICQRGNDTIAFFDNGFCLKVTSNCSLIPICGSPDCEGFCHLKVENAN